MRAQKRTKLCSFTSHQQQVYCASRSNPTVYQRRCGTLSSSLENVHHRTGCAGGMLPLLRTSALHPKESKDNTWVHTLVPMCTAIQNPIVQALANASFSPAMWTLGQRTPQQTDYSYSCTKPQGQGHPLLQEAIPDKPQAALAGSPSLQHSRLAPHSHAGMCGSWPDSQARGSCSLDGTRQCSMTVFWSEGINAGASEVREKREIKLPECL